MSRRAMEYTEAGFTLEDIKDILCRQPSVIGLSFQQNLLPKLLLLKGLGGKAGGDPLTEVEIRQLVVSFPSILTLSLANIESKLDYLVTELQRKHRDILACPFYLSTSMEKWIVPRTTYLQARGIDQHSFTLNQLFSSTDAKFCKSLGTDLEDYTAFKLNMHGK